MRIVALLIALLVCGLGFAQDAESGLVVQSVTVNNVSTSGAGMTGFRIESINAAWERGGVGLSVSSPFDVDSIEPAKQVLREMYESAGHEVRVEHSIEASMPRTVAVTFQVIELCRCE